MRHLPESLPSHLSFTIVVPCQALPLAPSIHPSTIHRFLLLPISKLPPCDSRKSETTGPLGAIYSAFLHRLSFIIDHGLFNDIAFSFRRRKSISSRYYPEQRCLSILASSSQQQQQQHQPKQQPYPRSITTRQITHNRYCTQHSSTQANTFSIATTLFLPSSRVCSSPVANNRSHLSTYLSPISTYSPTRLFRT